jgi:hypothetical protein
MSPSDAFLTDVHAHKAVVLDLDTGKRLEPDHWPRLGALPSGGGQQQTSQTSLKTEDLGEAQVEGVIARGLRTTTSSSVVEVWRALEIDEPPVLVHTREASREETRRLLNIRIRDPDRALFAALDSPE